MLWPSDKADALRAVGHVLDEKDATQVHLEESDSFLIVRSFGAGGVVEMTYSSAQLQALLEQARSRRSKAAPHPRSEYEQKLRVVGQQLDRKLGRSIRVQQQGSSFVATFLTRDAGRVRLTFTPSVLKDLMELAPRQRAGDDERRRMVTFE